MNTYFALLAEFGSAEIELERISGKWFGLEPREAKRRAAMHRLPVPAHRLNGQKSPWLVNAADLAAHIDRLREEAENQRLNMRAA